MFGSPGHIHQAIEAVRFTGKVGVVSYNKQDVTFNTKILVSKELNIYGSRNAYSEFEAVLEMIRSGAVPVEELITEVRGFDESARAFEDWKNDPSGITKILIKV
jgi:threonine dehydrogenase-like Zn-dependent dehydrogenase